jgi:G:T-mismatch repair DNA endonuclease (very short patch repair protein)
MPKKGFHHSEETKRKQSLASSGRKHSKQTKRKISESNRTRKISDETRRKKSESMKRFYAAGGKHPGKGTKRSEETRKRQSRVAKKRFSDPTKHPMYGKKQSKESRKKNSESQKKLHASGYQSPFKGKKHTKKAIAKMRASHKGAKSWTEGKHLSEETKRKISQSVKGFKHTEKAKKKMKKAQREIRARPNYVHPLLGKKDSKETKRKKSLAVKTRYADDITKHPMLGKTHRKSTKKKMQIARANSVFPRNDTKIEKILQELCDSVGIKYQKHKSFNLGFQYHQTDLFIEPNICIEADGDYWHAHPDYKSDKIIHYAHKNRKQLTAIDIRRKDKRITRAMEKQGLQVMRFWGRDIIDNPDECLQKIIGVLNLN